MPPERGEQTKVYRSHTVRILVPIALFSSLSRRGLGTRLEKGYGSAMGVAMGPLRL